MSAAAARRACRRGHPQQQQAQQQQQQQPQQQGFGSPQQGYNRSVAASGIMLGMSAAAARRACRRGDHSVAASGTMPPGSPPTDTDINVGRSGAFHRHLPVRHMRGANISDTSGASMPTAPPPTVFYGG